MKSGRFQLLGRQRFEILNDGFETAHSLKVQRWSSGGKREAVDRLFKVNDGRLDNLTPTQRTKLAERIYFVATGSKKGTVLLRRTGVSRLVPVKFGGATGAAA